jgi:hypothetical protein
MTRMLISSALMIVLLVQLGCRRPGPEVIIGQLDDTGRVRFVRSWSGKAAMLQKLTMWRVADSEPVCIVTADPTVGPTASSWRYGEEFDRSYRVAGCDKVEPGVYRLEFMSMTAATEVTLGICEVCMDRDGKMSFGSPSCKKGTCAAIH